MSTSFQVENIPLITDSDGAIRVGGTRVTLDIVLEAFFEGATAEEIVQQYPALNLADVYQVLGYYLRHQHRFAAYLNGRKTLKLAVRANNETQFNPSGLRDRLLARRKAAR